MSDPLSDFRGLKYVCIYYIMLFRETHFSNPLLSRDRTCDFHQIKKKNKNKSNGNALFETYASSDLSIVSNNTDV